MSLKILIADDESIFLDSFVREYPVLVLLGVSIPEKTGFDEVRELLEPAP